MSLSIDKKLFGGFGALFLAFITLALGAWILSGRLNDRVSELANVSGRSLQLAGDVQYLAANIKAEQRQVIILSAKQDMNGLKDQARSVESDAQAIVAKLDEIMRVSGGNARASADQARTAMQTWIANDWRKTRDLAEKSQTLEAVEASEAGRALLERAGTLAAAVVTQESDKFQANNEQAKDAYRALQLLSLVLLVAGIGIAVGVGYIVHSVHATLRGAATKLSSGAEMVVAAAGQMSSSSQSLSQSATEQAASLEETSASVEQLALMTRKNADATTEVVGHLREVDARANESNQALSDMVSAMAGIQDSSRQVSKIIKTIDEIAFQTNILALNAAVEAARAGTAGMGFAVVADEVRSLAHRSAQAAQDTNELISQSISRAQSGTSSVERLTGSIASIMQSVSNVKRLADDVSVASRQQAAGIEQVSKAVIELEKSTQAIAGTAEEGAAASEELNAHSETVIGVVGQLEVLVGSSSKDGAASTPGSDAGALPRPMAPRYRNVSAYTSSFGSGRHEGTGTFG
jgi:methyl-accepting chemotaxis protein/methyl-accepting chemotaxis protein-1 (serine sensor receptor)